MSESRPLRIGVAFVYHESNSFSPQLTGLDEFAAEDYHLGDDVIDVYSSTSTEVGGYLHVLEERAATPVPLMAAAAMPGGEVTDEAFAIIRDQFRQRLLAAHTEEPLDGLLLAMHGAMVTRSEDDPEGVLLQDAREILGADRPVAVTFDLHANVGTAPAEHGALIFGYQTYPHIDMRAQGERAAHTLLDVLEGKDAHVRTVRLPMLLRSINMRTDAGPMADVVAYARQHENEDVFAVSPHSGFPYADAGCSGAAVSVVAETPELAEDTCHAVARFFWGQRDRFQVGIADIESGIETARQALSSGDVPVVLADVADNPQSGGSADTTELPRAVLRAGLGSTLFSAVFDEAIVRQARRLGPGAEISGSLGGKLSPEFGGPLQIEATVIAANDGIYDNDGPFNAGLRVDTGGAALLRLRAVDGVGLHDCRGSVFDVVVTGRPITANDPALYRLMDVDPRDYEVLVWKVKNHFRAAFEPMVGRIIPVDAPGAARTDFTKLAFARTDRDHWPFVEDRDLGELHPVGPTAVVVREATVADARDIADFHVEVWRETYRELMDPGFLDNLSVEQREAEWKEFIADRADCRVLVARNSSGTLLGFGSTLAHPDGQGDSVLELHTLNLRDEARGTGLAKRLLHELIERSAAFLWVVEGNDRAVEFYQKAGFTMTSDRRPDPRCGVDDLRMVRIGTSGSDTDRNFAFATSTRAGGQAAGVTAW